VTDEVVIVPYDPLWPAMYESEAAEIRRALGGKTSVTLEHFGSTAIPGMSAKPVIDIMLGTKDKSRWPELVQPLQNIGYDFWEDNPNKERMFFVKGLPPAPMRTHHVHVFEIGSIYWDRLLFRDYLRSHTDEARQYEQLKDGLAAKFEDDRDAYTRGKEDFVRRIMERAGGRYSPSN
jgi:GrpB-like predicted nucleotidyltransferase (UPF0157 family)